MANIGLDIGTSGCKAAAYTADGVRIAHSWQAYELVSPIPGRAELDPKEIWCCVLKVLHAIAPACGESSCIAISGIGEAFVLIDAEGAPLNRFVTYLDDRGEDAQEEIRNAISDEELYRLTGVRPNLTYSINRLCWIRRHEPEIIQRSSFLMFVNEYFGFRLTGMRAVDPGTAVRSQLAYAGGTAWHPDLLALAGVSASLMAPIRSIGTRLGPILPEISLKLGLHKSTYVVLGCHDQCAAVLGAGAWNIGDTMLGEGSSESLNAVVDASAAHPTPERFRSELVAEPYFDGKSVLIAAQSSFCTSLKWFMQNISEDKQDTSEAYARWDARCPENTNLIFVPYLSALNVMDSSAKVQGAFLGLRITSSREEMYRAVLEGIHMESRRNLEIMQEMGAPLARLIANGGNSRSALSMQIKADILQHQIDSLEVPEAGVMGLAMIAAVADGAMADYPSAIRHFVRYGAQYTPERSYEEQYMRYLNYTRYLRIADVIWTNRKKAET